jgi:5-methyltetrahydropteroyltriglutamate--homocysteine methyltransferase
MSPRTSPPFRADHVGSLLRPPELLAARDDFVAGRITAEQLRTVEDAAIAAAVRMQESAGLTAWR